MSRTLILFAHPDRNSFNFSLLKIAIDTLRNDGHEVEVDDLYALNFDPLMTVTELREGSLPDHILAEQDKVRWAKSLIFIFPIWWWGPPAILKGWLERVLSQGFAFQYDVTLNRLVGKLNERKALVITTSSADPSTYESQWQAESQTSYVSDILNICGVGPIKVLNFNNVHAYALADELKSYQREVLDCARSLNDRVE